jgi:Right handed beta helix region
MGTSVVRTGLLVVLLGASLDAWAAPRTYVAFGGRDRSPCTLARPCRTFDAAVARTDPGGEVVALTSGEYGRISSIDKAIAVVGAPGVHAEISVASGHAVTVNAGPDDVIVLRGLTLRARPGTPPINGIVFNSGKALYVEGCVVDGFPTKGLLVLSHGRLHVEDSIFRGSFVGVSLDAPIRASLDRVRLEDNGFGLVSGLGAVATARDCVAVGNTEIALLADSTLTPGELNVDGCLVTQNAVGIESRGVDNDVALLRVSRSTVTNNQTGLHPSGNGVLLSRGDNTVEGNATDVDGVLLTFAPR